MAKTPELVDWAGRKKFGHPKVRAPYPMNQIEFAA